MPLLTAILVVAAGLTGCGDINHGDQLARDFRAWMKGVEGVAAVDAGGQNVLPWAGTGSGTVTLDPDVDAARVHAVVDRANDFPSRHELSVRVVHEADGATGAFDVPRGPQETVDATVEASLAVVGLDHVVSFDLTAADRVDRPPSALVVTDGDVLDVVDAVSPVLRDGGLAVGTVAVEDEDAAITARTSEAGDLDGPRAALAAVAASYPVLEADLDPGALVVRVDAARTPDVAAAAEAAAPGTVVTVHFGTVTTGAPGDYGRALALADAAQATGLVVAIEAEPDAVQIEVADVAAALEVDAVLRGVPEVRGMRVGYTTTDGVSDLTTTRTGLAPYAAALTALDDELSGRLEEVRLHDRSLDVRTVPTDAPVEARADAHAVGRAGALLPDGVDVSVFVGPVGFAVTSRPAVRRADLDVYAAQDADDPLLDGFVEGWSSAA